MNPLRAAPLAVLLLLLFAAPPPSFAKDLPLPDVRETTLQNGMKVLLLEDHDIPNCALTIAWRVGSRNEVTGITGLAHFFEHMMFTGGAKYGTTFDTTMEAAGGSNTAWTTRDATTYVDWFPKSALPLILEMEADRIHGMVFDPRTVASEREVVLSEQRLTLEEPIERLYRQIWAAAYTAHPYQWEVLGWTSDIRAWTKQDLERFFATYYAPQNATLVLVGDVDADAALALVRERLGTIPRGPDRPVVHTVEPEQEGERRVALDVPPHTMPAQVMAWHVPATADADTAALSVVDHLLLQGEASRLHERLVEKEQLCLYVFGGLYGLQFDPSIFSVDAMMREAASAADVERVVWEELKRLGEEGPSDEELIAARSRLRVGLLHRMRTIHGMASLLAETELFYGGWKNLPARLAALRAVTKDDVKRVVKTYLTRRNVTIGTLVVQDASKDAPEPAFVGEGGGK
jgi:predicted Zn-dependent peptidase